MVIAKRSVLHIHHLHRHRRHHLGLGRHLGRGLRRRGLGRRGLRRRRSGLAATGMTVDLKMFGSICVFFYMYLPVIQHINIYIYL